MQREMQLSLDPSYLKAVSMNELFDTQYQSKPPLIDGLLYPGTYIFAGSPKLGKSFLMAQLAYHVSTGRPLWNYTTRKGTVLYLALEDDYRRLQERLYRMFGTESADNLFFSVSASQLGKGLDEQLARFVAEHTDTKLIMSRPRQHRHLKRKNSILFLVFLDFPHFFIHSGWQDTLF